MTAQTVRRVGGGILAAFTATMLVCSLSAWRFAPNAGQAAADWPGNYFIQSLVRWDAGWYGQIAVTGYWYRPGVQTPVAFFPLYPLVLHGLVALGLNVWLSGVIVTSLCGAVAATLFFSWARSLSDEGTARRATWILLLYPFSIFLYGIMYSDALYLMLAVGAFLLLERGQLVPATVLGALASAARPIAPALVLGLLARRIEWRRQRGERLQLRDGLPLAASFGFLAYALYLGVRFGDPLAFVHAEAAPGWDQSPGWHTWLKLTWVDVMAHHPSPLTAFRLAIHSGVSIGLLAMVPATFRRVSPAYALYLLLVVLMPTIATKDFVGLGRYGLAAFPAFLTLSRLLEARPLARRVWLGASGALLLLFAVGFGATKYVS